MCQFVSDFHVMSVLFAPSGTTQWRISVPSAVVKDLGVAGVLGPRVNDCVLSCIRMSDLSHEYELSKCNVFNHTVDLSV